MINPVKHLTILREKIVFRTLVLLTSIVLYIISFKLGVLHNYFLLLSFLTIIILFFGEYLIKKSGIKILTVIFIIFFLHLIIPHKVIAQELNAPPTQIIIPKTAISLPVFKARIAYNTWEVRLDGASFGESSTPPGDKGNTIIFSHALPKLFGNLPAIQVGDTINVFTHLDWFVYKVIKKDVVDPENVEVLNELYPYQLTLYTCTGPNYSQRFVIRAELQANTSSSQF